MMNLLSLRYVLACVVTVFAVAACDVETFDEASSRFNGASAAPPAGSPPPMRAATMSVIATGGGLVFGGDTNGRFRALDHETGEILWEINLGSAVTGPPITYAVDGRQYVAVSTGTAGLASAFTRMTPEIRPSAGNNMFVFALPD